MSWLRRRVRRRRRRRGRRRRQCCHSRVHRHVQRLLLLLPLVARHRVGALHEHRVARGGGSHRQEGRAFRREERLRRSVREGGAPSAAVLKRKLRAQSTALVQAARMLLTEEAGIRVEQIAALSVGSALSPQLTLQINRRKCSSTNVRATKFRRE